MDKICFGNQKSVIDNSIEISMITYLNNLPENRFSFSCNLNIRYGIFINFWSDQVIHLTSISKQHGSQILFKNASLQILSCTKIGLVEANDTA